MRAKVCCIKSFFESSKLNDANVAQVCKVLIIHLFCIPMGLETLSQLSLEPTEEKTNPYNSVHPFLPFAQVIPYLGSHDLGQVHFPTI